MLSSSEKWHRESLLNNTENYDLMVIYIMVSLGGINFSCLPLCIHYARYKNSVKHVELFSLFQRMLDIYDISDHDSGS